ncbi:MAG: DUF3568 family protein [Bacteroidetes bacterium]|nr:DUF3568 family protein [Bacteroidota bacterium]
MKGAFYIFSFSLLFLAGCGTLALSEGENIQTYNSSFNDVFDATIQYLQDAGYGINTQTKSDAAPYVATVRTEEREYDNERSQVRILIQGIETGVTRVSISLDIEARTEQGGWIEVIMTGQESDMRFSAILGGIGALL